MRNLILVLATLGVVALLFVGYVQMTAVQVQTSAADARAAKPLPQAMRDPAQNIQVGPVDVPPGEEFSFVVYDERTGRPTDRFRCKQWRKVAGSENEVTVTEPELSMLLPSGMLATITADAGRIVVDRIDTRRMRPKLGWLSGNARIVIDRETAADRTPSEQRPDDLVTIAAEKFAFDLEVGRLQLDGALHVSSAEFEISGTGLELLWNQVGNRVERLVIQRGDRMEVQLSRGMPAGLRDATRSDRRDQTASRPADGLAEGRAARGAHARATSYRLTLTGGVSADHLRGEQRVGGLKSDALSLLFDAGGSSAAPATQSAPTSQPATQSAPASQPATTQPAPPEKLVVRWGGLLTLDPVGTRDPSEPSRRQLEATGQAVTLESPDGTVRCGGLRYEDESQRAWLRPADAGRVAIMLNQRVRVEAASVFIDRGAGVAKLIGPVTMKSASRGDGRETLAISCGLWAELHLAARGKPAAESVAPGQLIDAAELKSAVFNGDVRVQLGERRLHAIKLETRFRAPEGNEGLDELLDEALAAGSVRMTAGRADGALPRWARVVPDRIERLLHAEASQGGLLGPGDTQGLECAAVRMRFQRDEGGRAYVSAVNAEGAVRLVDLEYEVRARGQSLDADVAQSEQITRAAVRGTPGKPAVVQAQEYVVHGETIHFDEIARTMEVAGPSHLSFESDRTLRGERQSRGQRVAVRSSRSLRVDGLNNRIDFIGDVVAQSQQDQLLADSLTLLLKDVSAPAARPRPFASLRDALAVAGPAPAGSQPARSHAAGERRERMRKEPARLLAQRAVIQSETYRPGDAAPLVHQSVAAPELEVDISSRLLRTTGETTLLMTSRQLDVDAAAVREATGLPSSLMSRGPSQTAMRCARSMTYVLGPDGAQRRDSVLFEGEVRFRHVAGRQMVGWEELLPEASRNPELLKKVRDRNTYMECDRLEGAFVSQEQRPGAVAAARSNLSLAWLNALGNVYMRDEQGPGVREIQAHQVEFDRPNGKVRVLGNKEDGRLARVWYQNAQTGQFDNPAAGPEFIIDLNTNTLKSGATTGEFRRP